MDTFNVRKWRKKSAHGYFSCTEVDKEISTWIRLMFGSGERSQHMDTFNVRKWRKKSAHGYC
jgi:hypothetical protein